MPKDGLPPLAITLADEAVSRSRAPSFAALLDGRTLCRSTTPIYDAARVLLDLGHDPETILEARHEGDETVAMSGPVGVLAKWTVEESDRRGLRLRKWTPHPASQKADSRGAGSPYMREPAPEVLDQPPAKVALYGEDAA